jgi:5-methylcytosine-specific restriction endonuclease McrA
VTVLKTEAGLLYKQKKDKQGVTRRLYQLLCKTCHKPVFIQKSRLKTQQFCQECAKLLSPSPETRVKISKTLQQKYVTDIGFKERVNAARNIPKGEQHWNWKGGVTPLTQKTRTSEGANAWKLAVFHRDQYKCRMCGSKDNIQAHHINSWADFPEDRFVLQNGLTMCKPCHDTYHKYEKEVRRNEN